MNAAERPIEEIVAADAFVRGMVPAADGVQQPFPTWHGWALRDAYLAGLDAGRKVPADDGEALTKSWLIEQGGKAEHNPLKVTFERGEHLALGFWECDDGWKIHLLITDYHSAQVVRGLKTRGDFRAIAAMLPKGEK